MQKNVTFKKGNTPRNELELPTLHFVVMDQWIEVIGEKALFSWLKFYTWCKRDDKSSEHDLWEQAKIPTSYNTIIKKLGVGKDTFYNKILKPLWNVGLIDIEEYEQSEVKGNKPMNIIVYKYPQNSKALAHEEIKVIRDYDKDYSSNAKTFAKKGGRPKNTTSDKDSLGGGSQIEPGVVLKENQGWFSNRTRGGSQIEPINILNSINNSFNSLNNILNGINNNLNLKHTKTSNIHKQQENESTNKEQSKADILEQLWDLKIPKDLKVKIKVLLANNNLSLSSNDLFEIEEAYQFQVQKQRVLPNSNADTVNALNDIQFTNTVYKMLNTVQSIDSMKGLIDSWVKTALDYKFNELHGTDYGLVNNPESPFYDRHEAFKEILGH